MFKKWGTESENYIEEEQKPADTPEQTTPSAPAKSNTNDAVNKILRGSKLKGNINVTCDLELSGDVEGNITSESDSSIIIKGTCKGNIETKGGNVDIDGELHEGDIVAGKNVTISGKFAGGEIRAKGKIYINGEFNGKLSGSEVELGPEAQGKGEISYIEQISIARGAQIEVQISKGKKELTLVKNTPEKQASGSREEKDSVKKAN